MTIDEAVRKHIPRIRVRDWPDPANYVWLQRNGDAEYYPDAWASPAGLIPFRALTGSYGWEEYCGPVEQGKGNE